MFITMMNKCKFNIASKIVIGFFVTRHLVYLFSYFSFLYPFDSF